MRIRIPGALVAILMGIVTLATPAGGTGLEDAIFGEPEACAPGLSQTGTPDPVELSGTCSINLYCDDGSSYSCTCPNPTAGSCSAVPGAPWGGAIHCNCTGTQYDRYYACNEPNPGCTQRSCDTQCGGPGYGVCSGDRCYCY